MKRKIVAGFLLIALSISITPIPILAADNNQPQLNATTPLPPVPGIMAVGVQPLTQYRLSKYDVINVAIIGLDEANFRDIMVGPDGYVNLPYAGTVKLAGLTVPEATSLLTEKLGEYIKIPGMAVMVTKYGPRKVYVLGEVKTPGVYTLGWDNMNIIAALSSAGGIALKGRPKHIGVARMVDGKIQMQKVNFDNLVEKADLSQNVALEDGDLVYVPKSNKIDLYQDIMPILTTGVFLHTLTKD